MATVVSSEFPHLAPASRLVLSPPCSVTTNSYLISGGLHDRVFWFHFFRVEEKRAYEKISLSTQRKKKQQRLRSGRTIL